MKVFKGTLAFVAAVALLVVAIALAQSAFNTILDFRKLERIPLTTIIGSTDGEVHLRGYVFSPGQELIAPNTQSECVYYRYSIEEEYQDSDGDTRWRTIHSETKAIDFELDDRTAKAKVLAQVSIKDIKWGARKAFTRTVGRLRYTEWRIDIDDFVTVYGWMESDLTSPTVNFSTSGDYLPIVSSQTGNQERNSLGWSSILRLAGGVAALAFMCLCLVISFGWHRVLLYLTLVSFSTTMLLLHYGWQSLKQDVLKGYERFEKQQSRSQQRTRALLYDYDIQPFSGFDVNDTLFSDLTEAEKQKLNSWRMSSYLVREQYLRQINQFPENIYAVLRRVDKPSPILLPDDQLAFADQQLENFKPTRIERNYLLNAIAFVFVIVTAWFAFRFIKVKRIIENIPTTKTTGVTYGLMEVLGRLKADPDTKPLRGPLTGLACCWFNYTVQEKRGSGKDEKWVTIENRTEKQAFFCEDDEGEIRVFPTKAEIVTHHLESSVRGDRCYTERRLSPDDTLYCLGKAVPDRRRGDTLVLTHDKDMPFIISNKPEHEVMMMKALRGMAMLTVGISALFFMLLLIAGSKGSFSSFDYLLASALGPALLMVFMLVIMFNDLVFLRQRSHRCWANIQVSLKKRASLIPQLERVVKRLLVHENELLEEITLLRVQAKRGDSTSDVDQYMRNEHVFIEHLQATIEDYPELQSDKNMQDLHRRIVKLENEIAMIRSGFNDAVTLYNTRIQQFPDVFLAKMFRFERLSLLSFDKTAHQVPEV